MPKKGNLISYQVSSSHPLGFEAVDRLRNLLGMLSLMRMPTDTWAARKKALGKILFRWPRRGKKSVKCK